MSAESLLPVVPFRWNDARARGLSRRRFDQLVAERMIRRVLHNVYVLASEPDTVESRAAAAALVVGPSSVLCDRTAAWLLGVDTFDYHELDLLPPLDTFVLRGRARSRRPECTGGERDLAESDVCRIGEVRLTTPLRTALDLGCHLPRRDALAALDAFMRHYGLTHDEMRRAAVRYFRRRGVVQLRELIPLADPRAESPGESWTRLAIIDAGLPAPRPQLWVQRDGVPAYRLDLAYPHARVCVEYDGRQFHEGAEVRDEARRAWLRQQGWKVIVVTKDSFTDDALAAWLRELRVAVRRAA